MVLKRRGAISLLMVMLFSVLGAFILSTWQVRVLYSQKRAKALSESIVAGYSAESKIYDTVARFLGGFAAAFTFPFERSETLAGGVRLNLSGEENGNVQTLTAVAESQYSSVKIRLDKTDTSETEEIARDMEIVFSLDCTGSMGSKACETCSTTRMDEQKNAVMAFLDALEASRGSEKVKVGISVFSMVANWMNTAYDASGHPIGTDVNPNSSLSIGQIKSAISNNLKSSGEFDSPACISTLNSTNAGAGVVFMHDYFKSVSESKSRVEILITDGEPNQRTPYPGCPKNVFCPAHDSYCCPAGWNCYETRRISGGTGWSCPLGAGVDECAPHARDFLRCALATSDQRWTMETSPHEHPWGTRDPGVDIYAVTVLDRPPAEVTEVFNTYATEYFNSANASRLTTILSEIFEKISKKESIYNIYKVVPTP